MSSIYLSICSLNDSELIPTIDSAISKSSGENSIYFGIAYSSMELDKNQILERGRFIQELYPSCKFTYYNSSVHRGTGVGRRKAYEMYSNEDYLLQVDCHTRFDSSWDSILIDQLNYAQELYGKSVITGYPDSYYYQNGQEFIANNWMPYVSDFIDSHIASTQYRDDPELYNILPNFEDRLINLLPGEFEINKKISGGLLFGDKEFAQNFKKLIPYDYTLPEEELFMSVELINLGYKLVTPCGPTPIAHLYYQDIDGSLGKREILSTNFLYRSEARDLIIQYYLNNKDKIKKFEEYAEVDMWKYFLINTN